MIAVKFTQICPILAVVIIYDPICNVPAAIRLAPLEELPRYTV
jgi:hypothetical protein